MKPRRPLSNVNVGSVGDILDWGARATIPGYGLAKDAIDYPFAPSPAAIANFEELKKRWGNIQSWGPPGSPSLWFAETLPAFAPQYQSWIDFDLAWKAQKADLTALQAQSIDLEVAENIASGYGYPGDYHQAFNNGVRYGTDNKVHSVPVEDQTLANHGADTIVKNVPGTNTGPGECTAISATGINWSCIWKGIPLPVKVGVGVLGSVYVLGAIVVPLVTRRH